MSSSSDQPAFLKVRIEDVDELSKVASDTFFDAFAHLNTQANMAHYLKQAFSTVQLSQELNNDSSLFYFLVIDSEIMGYLKLNLRDAQTEDIDIDAIEIQRIYLYAKAQGQGYGKQMVEYAEEVGRQHECPMIWLGVWQKNHKSIAFYENMGFKTFDKHDFPFGDEVQTDLLMNKKV